MDTWAELILEENLEPNTYSTIVDYVVKLSDLVTLVDQDMYPSRTKREVIVTLRENGGPFAALFSSLETLIRHIVDEASQWY